MNDRGSAKEMDGKLYRVVTCFGKEFPIYYRYSDEDGNSIPDYPDFRASPQYTGDGRPFVLATQDGCRYGASELPGEPFGGECGSCEYFTRGTETPFSVFGLCMCDKRQRPQCETEE